MNIFRNNKIHKLPPTVKAVEKHGNLSVVKLAGAFDFNTISSVENVMKEHRDHLDQDVVLDFKEVTHIDTSTLAVLIYIMDRLKQKHRKLGLINCNKLVRDYIKISKLESVIHVYKTLKDAINASG
ncbi:MAG: STAS domain-containing protein [Candidatus Omnitrophica bacterium]|nr:STAS domain-containing protein [Candidatus Omnitrophota bacterium]